MTLDDMVSKLLGYPSASVHREKLIKEVIKEVTDHYVLFRDSGIQEQSRMIGEAFHTPKQAGIMMWFLLEVHKLDE